MVLFHHIIQILDLPDDDVGAVGLIVALNGGCIGLTAIDGDLLGYAVAANRLLQKPQGRLLIPLLREQKVNRLALLIDGAIQIPPRPLDADIGILLANAWDWS